MTNKISTRRNSVIMDNESNNKNLIFSNVVKNFKLSINNLNEIIKKINKMTKTINNFKKKIKKLENVKNLKNEQNLSKSNDFFVKILKNNNNNKKFSKTL